MSRRRAASLSPGEGNRVAADFQAAVLASPFDMQVFEPYMAFLRQVVDPPSIPDVAALRQYPGLAGDLLPREADKEAEAVTILWLSGDEESREVRDRAIDAVHAALAGVDGVTLTGLPVMGHDADMAVDSELPKLLLIAAALVAGYLLIHFRKLSSTILALTPAVLGLAVLGMVARFCGIKLNMVNLVALPLLIGIDVDYGIYLVSLGRDRTALAGGAPRGGGLRNVDDLRVCVADADQRAGDAVAGAGGGGGSGQLPGRGAVGSVPDPGGRWRRCGNGRKNKGENGRCDGNLAGKRGGGAVGLGVLRAFTPRSRRRAVSGGRWFRAPPMRLNRR